jgi:hypothetical protein
MFEYTAFCGSNMDVADFRIDLCARLYTNCYAAVEEFIYRCKVV